MDYSTFIELANWLWKQAALRQGATVDTQEHGDKQGSDSETGYEHIAGSDYTSSHSTLPNAADDSVLNSGYETTPYEYCGSHNSSASSTSVDSFEFDLCEEFNADSDSLAPPSDTSLSSPTFKFKPHDYDFPGAWNSTDASGASPDIDPVFFMLPGTFISPVSSTNPYDFTSPNSADTSPVTASRTWDTASGATLEGPQYLNSLSRPYDDAAHDPSNVSLPLVSGTTSTAYGGVLGNFWYGEEDPAVDDAQEEQGADSSAGSADITVPEENNNTDNVNVEQIGEEQSAWAVNFLYEEGIETFQNTFDHDTGAGPSTGSSVAAAMLDIGHAPHGRSRDEGAAAIISAAPEEAKGKGKGKRKAVDAPERPPPSKKLHVEPSPPQMMDIFICSWPTPASSTDPERPNQRAATGPTSLKFIQVLPATASGGEQLLSLSGGESTYGTLVQAKDGELKARSMVSARDSHVRHLARKGNQ